MHSADLIPVQYLTLASEPQTNLYLFSIPDPNGVYSMANAIFRQSQTCRRESAR